MELWRIARLILSAIYDLRAYLTIRLRVIEDRMAAQDKILKSIQNAVVPEPAEKLKLTIGSPVPNFSGER